MSRTITAVFDAGVFRPLEPVALADGTQVELQVQVPIPPKPDQLDAETKKAWDEYLERMDSLPDKSPQDGLTNRDHDRIVYGS